MTDTVTADPGAAFADMMNSADAPAAAPTARGRRRPPSVDELKGAPLVAGGEDPEGEAAGPTLPGPAADRAPEAPKRGRGRPKGTAGDDGKAPAYKAGVIAKGVNRLYRKTGKIIRGLDPDIGEAFIESARNTADDGEDDDSVGAAWDELARTNPRIRAFLMKFITGGAYGQLAMAHAPIALAIIMKPAIFGRIPFQNVVASVAEPDDDSPPDGGGLPGGMTAADAAQMGDLLARQMQRMGMPVPPEVAEQMAQAAAAGPVPALPFRSQPRRPASRAHRKGG